MPTYVVIPYYVNKYNDNKIICVLCHIYNNNNHCLKHNLKIIKVHSCMVAPNEAACIFRNRLLNKSYNINPLLYSKTRYVSCL